VTNIEYARFVQAEKIEPPNHWDGRDNPPRGQANHPVVHVSWNDAQAYVDWLNRHPGGGNIMLPSEAQWERAARGPQLWQGKENRRRWPWGDAADAIGEYANAEMNVSRTTPVGCYPRGASPEGIFDLAGNIFEWCRDSPREYRAAGERDPEGPLDGLRVLRGGGWLDGGRYLRAATRGALEPGKRFYLVGFRLAGG
jgi:formylglycine-generating enzyme required for sulfatase activity